MLELLAAICLVKGGHELIIAAFDRFKKVWEVDRDGLCMIELDGLFQEHAEERRFQTLFGYFRDYDEFHVDFMVACMQFVNIVVHSVEDMNYRIFLQYEYNRLGLDDYLESVRYGQLISGRSEPVQSEHKRTVRSRSFQKLKFHESEQLQVQIQAYLENAFDVAQLLEDSDMKNCYMQQLEEKQMELSRVTIVDSPKKLARNQWSLW